MKESTTSRLFDWGNGGFGGDAIDERLDIAGGWDVASVNDSAWSLAPAVQINSSIVLSVSSERVTE